MSNIAFALQRSLAITRHHVAIQTGREPFARAQALTNLIREVSRLASSSGFLKTKLELFDLDDLGEVAGISLYSGQKLHRETMDIIVVPDLSALAVREDVQHTHHFHLGKTYELVETVSLFVEDERFKYSYPQASHELDIENEIMTALHNLKEGAVSGRFVR